MATTERIDVTFTCDWCGYAVESHGARVTGWAGSGLTFKRPDEWDIVSYRNADGERVVGEVCNVCARAHGLAAARAHESRMGRF